MPFTTYIFPYSTSAVDEKLYSRQLYVMGHEAQRRMMASTCLLVGLSGCGVEVAKNTILAGLNRIVLADPVPPTSFDLGGNFYLTPEDLSSGKSRASLCRPHLAQLNPYVKVDLADIPDLASETILELITSSVSVVVVTIPLPTGTLVAINEQCRAVGASFIYALTMSVFGQVFCDFGAEFLVFDKDGEPAASSQIETVLTDESPPTVKVLEDQGRHGLETGDKVTFSRLKGVPGLENNVEYLVTVTGPYTFTLDGLDLSQHTVQHPQGYITQVKQPVKMAFESYKDKLANPGEMMMSDFAKFDRPPLLHAAFQAVAQYQDQHGQLPSDAASCQQVLELSKKINPDAFTDFKAERIVLHLAHGSQAILSPMCAALGGVVGQEVLKACSGKFTPISGFLYLDADECLPDTLLPPDLAPLTNSRYDSQILVFGQDIQEKLGALNYFLIGAGAIGCEMLKNWAMMGVACGSGGMVHVTDMDRIEKSNLSRQFLFRNTDINEFKSTTAAKAAQHMNPQFKVTAYQEKVAPDTEYMFGDDFYDKLSGVCTALDNVEARLYVDQRCLFYRLPMMESGTLGTKGNTQIVVPHLTEHYGATRDPPEKSIPVCTLKNFPNQIEHTLQWARDWFEGAFKQASEEVNGYIKAGEMYLESLHPNTKAETIKLLLQTLDRPTTYQDCVTWARLTFENQFSNQILQLLHNFPADQVTSSGQLFWSGSKRCPKALMFDPHEIDADANAMKTHLEFVVMGANLRAEMYGIQVPSDADVLDMLEQVIVPDFVPAEGVKIAANEAEAEEQKSSGESDNVVDLLAQLPKPAELVGMELVAIEFDKDIDAHNTFVTACSNCRAMNYSIPTADTHRSRAIAGRIIPAIATTTALVTGLICLELYKLIGAPRKELAIEAYKNGYLNLAVPFMTMSEPNPPAKTKSKLQGKEWEWTAWDSLDITLGDITMGEFMEYFEEHYNLEISMLSHGVSILYSFFANKKKIEERKAMKMTEVITSITKKEFPANQLFLILEVIANDKETDEEVELPYIKFRFR